MIRVLLAHMPPILRDIIRDAVMNEPDVEVVATVEVNEPFLQVLGSVPIDVLILGASPPNDLALAEEVWAKWPRIKVLMIAHGGRSAVLHALHPHKIVLGDISSQSLIAAIRGALAW